MCLKHWFPRSRFQGREDPRGLQDRQDCPELPAQQAHVADPGSPSWGRQASRARQGLGEQRDRAGQPA